MKPRQTKAALIIPERSPHSTPLLAVYLMKATLACPPRAVRADAAASYYYSSFCSSLYMRLNSTRTTTASTLQLWLCTGPHPAGFSLPDQPQMDKTMCAASQCAGLQVKRSVRQLTPPPPPFHQPQPRVLLQVFGVSAEAASYKVCTYITLQHRQEEKKAPSHNMERKRTLNRAGRDDC